MLLNHKGRAVKWIGGDGGWKTGHVVAPMGLAVHRQVFVAGNGNVTSLATLVQHSCTGEIEFVLDKNLTPWPSREEWETSGGES